MKKIIYAVLLLWFIAGLSTVFAQKQKRQMENLGRGMVAVHQFSGNALGKYTGKVCVSWRLLSGDSKDIAFNLYRSTNGAEAIKLNTTPITNSTNYLDGTMDLTKSNSYFVKPVLFDAVSKIEEEQAASAAFTLKANATIAPCLTIPLDMIANDATYGYAANDASVGDLDGDGEYEIVVKRDNWSTDNMATPNNIKMGTTKLEAYKLDGTFMWRVDLGYNVRQGAHYTYFMVYDFDGDGKSEVVVRTAEGTTFGDGTTIGDTDGDGKTDYVNTSSGMILDGPQFFSVIEGATGKELTRADYISRTGDGNSQSATTKALWAATWGDNYGNRIDRFLGGVGYFDGERPSILICRGYYGKSVLEAWDYRDGQLTKRWNFDTESSEANKAYRGQGFHNLRIGDVDGDGKDEVVYGAMAIDNDGMPLYNTKLGHGDAMHMSDFDPDIPGLETFAVHEDNAIGIELRDSLGKILWSVPSGGADVGRGVMADIDPLHRGAEGWASITGNLYDCKGNVICNAMPTSKSGSNSYNSLIWWDGDVLREILDETLIGKWDWENQWTDRLAALWNYGASPNNSTKGNASLSADILGDWREEVLFRSGDNKSLLLFVTPYIAINRFVTFMQDPTYRISVATENNGYNQPPTTGFLFGVETTANTPTSGLGTYICLHNVPQSITFGELPIAYVEDTDIAVLAVANSALSVTYTSSDENVATIVDGQIHIVGAGTCTITATQAGNYIYLPTSATQTLKVNTRTNIVNQINANNIAIYPNPCVKNANVSYGLNEKSEVEIDLFDVLGNKIKNVLDNTQQAKGNYSIPISMTELSQGIYFVKVRVNSSTKTLKVVVK